MPGVGDLGGPVGAILLWGAVAGALFAVGKLAVAAWRMVRVSLAWASQTAHKVAAINDLIERELNHNHGTSIKDQAAEGVRLARENNRLLAQHIVDGDRFAREALKQLAEHGVPLKIKLPDLPEKLKVWQGGDD